MERQEYEMSDEDLKELKEASKPVPYMIFGGRGPSSPQENANRAWQSLGNKMLFDWETVQPIEDKGIKFFTAIPK